MFCQSCGTEVPNGVAFCPTCGNQMSQGDSAADMFSQPYQQPVGGTSGTLGQQPYVATKPKKNTGAIVAIIISILAVLGLAAFLVIKFVVLKDDDESKDVDYNGRYKLESMVQGGMTVTADMLSVYGFEMYIEIDGTKLTGDLMGEHVEGTVEDNDGELSLTFSGKPAVGTYNSSTKELTLTYEGTTMIFKKVD